MTIVCSSAIPCHAKDTLWRHHRQARDALGQGLGGDVGDAAQLAGRGLAHCVEAPHTRLLGRRRRSVMMVALCNDGNSQASALHFEDVLIMHDSAIRARGPKLSGPSLATMDARASATVSAAAHLTV